MTIRRRTLRSRPRKVPHAQFRLAGRADAAPVDAPLSRKSTMPPPRGIRCDLAGRGCGHAWPATTCRRPSTRARCTLSVRGRPVGSRSMMTLHDSPCVRWIGGRASSALVGEGDLFGEPRISRHRSSSTGSKVVWPTEHGVTARSGCRADGPPVSASGARAASSGGARSSARLKPASTVGRIQNSSGPRPMMLAKSSDTTSARTRPIRAAVPRRIMSTSSGRAGPVVVQLPCTESSTGVVVLMHRA